MLIKHPTEYHFGGASNGGWQQMLRLIRRDRNSQSAEIKAEKDDLVSEPVRTKLGTRTVSELKRIAIEDKNQMMRIGAVQVLVELDRGGNQEFFKKRAQNDSSDRVRGYLYLFIDDIEFLVKRLKKEKNESMQDTVSRRGIARLVAEDAETNGTLSEPMRERLEELIIREKRISAATKDMLLGAIPDNVAGLENVFRDILSASLTGERNEKRDAKMMGLYIAVAKRTRDTAFLKQIGKAHWSPEVRQAAKESLKSAVQKERVYQ